MHQHPMMQVRAAFSSRSYSIFPSPFSNCKIAKLHISVASLHCVLCSVSVMPISSVHSVQILSAHQYFPVNFSKFPLHFPVLNLSFRKIFHFSSRFHPKSTLTICFFAFFFIILHTLSFCESLEQ